MATWIYFATAEKTSLASTRAAVENAQFLWRSARNSNGALIPNVREIREGDRIVVAWRHPKGRRTAYLCCRVARPLSPVDPSLVIDKLTGPDAQALVATGYPADASGVIEGIRLDEIEECHFEVRGTYGGQNALHRLAAVDLSQILGASTIRPDELLETPTSPRTRCEPNPIVSTGTSPTPVDNIVIQATGDDRAFDAYAMVDWSSSSHPTVGNDSIWIASGAWSGRTFIASHPENVSTRREAMDRLRRRIVQWRDDGKRVLVGFDFAFGYPAGFAMDAVGLDPEAANSSTAFT